MGLNYFDVRKVRQDSPNTTLFYLIGQRGVGKTYSAKKDALEDFMKHKKKFIYVRRWTTEIQGRELATVFSDILDDEEVLGWFADYDSDDRYHCFHVLPKSGEFWIVGEKTNGALEWIETCGRITCISKAEQFKGGTYNDFSCIIFDEFITEMGYVHGDKEPELFAKIVGTVGRNIDGRQIRIYMCGNPDASIEANPYLYNLMLDYAHLQTNTAYYYDTRTESGKIIANNVLFIKLAGFEGTFLDERTSSLWSTSEEHMSISGDVKSNKYIHLDEYLSDFRADYELQVETPVLSDSEWHRKLYAYYGTLWNEPVLVVLGHRKIYTKDVLFCRYDKNDFRKRTERQTYRLNIPPEDAFKGLRYIMSCVDANQLIITDDDAHATLFEQIRLNA